MKVFGKNKMCSTIIELKVWYCGKHLSLCCGEILNFYDKIYGFI
jgi:hypothetical protein